ncbi:MAG: cobalamin-binding protein [Zoogloeaceae bacterium]|nr:cobalamin-binding protein [Rhodocyclaceae bacterium]MCP5236593.1 cobalamin-binding protein [Zoogloeaceae bacterium]
MRNCLAWLLMALILPAPARAVTLEDANGQVLTLAAPARRIVSLAPHITELVYAAGAGGQLVGVVNFSDYPPAAAALTQIGSYNALDLEAIASLRPDLALGWRSGNREAHLARLRALGIPVFVSEARSLEEVAASIEQIGTLAGTGEVATAAADAFRERHALLRSRYQAEPPVRMFYQVWNDPLMTINGEHLISAVIRLCGGVNVFAGLDQLAPKINQEAVLAADPEAIVASGMDQARPEWLDDWRRWRGLTAVGRDNLFFIPPDLLQRHTPRVLDGAEQLCGQLDTARERRPPRSD